MNRTPLFAAHVAAGAKMVDFHGWEMPLNYGSQLEEHHQVRRDAGVFDTSHMTVVDVAGAQAKALQKLLANDVARLTVTGKALYSGMLNEEGGVIDDLIVYFFDDEHYRLIVNSATREKDLAWLALQAQPFGVTLTERAELAMLAIQGPQALAKVSSLLNSEQAQQLAAMKPFFGVAMRHPELGELFVATTGYTGEKGCEMLVHNDHAVALWDALLAAGVKPCGLGARDTLRLEAGMNLYGQEMDESVLPLHANMGWTIAWEPAERGFIGRGVLEAERPAPKAQLIGLVLEEKGVLRTGQQLKVTAADGSVHEGVITSGSFSPTLGQGIALARVPVVAIAGIEVDMRKKWITVKPVKPNFVRNGQSVVAPL